jgi:F1F0 ATPase subunit 2
MVLGFLAGLLLGLFFFGGLYWSVEKLAQVKNPAILMLLSLLVRMAALMGGFILLFKRSLAEGVAALFGVIFVKFLLIAYSRKNNTEEGGEKKT